MDKQLKDENRESRRSFLKKAVYVTPTIIALGSVTNLSANNNGASCTALNPCTDNEVEHPGPIPGSGSGDDEGF